MMPGETIRSGADQVCTCGVKFEFEPMESGAGWFVGTYCHNQDCPHVGEPNSRESEYYPSEAAVVEALRTNTVRWRT
jgi:hypothetical protein